ncbi:unnamed protein product [Trichobilharzia szidati]|nr:unnamed protein product [Trichobilharzia szidati]
MAKFILCSLFVFLLIVQTSPLTFQAVIENEIKRLNDTSYQNLLLGRSSSVSAKIAREEWRVLKEKINEQLASQNKTLDNYVVCISGFVTSDYNASVYRDLLIKFEEIQKEYWEYFKGYKQLVTMYQNKLNRNEGERLLPKYQKCDKLLPIKKNKGNSILINV